MERSDPKAASIAVSDRTYLERLADGPACKPSGDRTLKLLLPLMTLVGAVSVLVTGWGGWSISYL
jgi:hypothetical protein